MYMSLTWVKPLPLLFMTASVLLMWAPSRAFLGAAVSKLPRLVLSKRRRCSAATDHRYSTTLASVAGQDRRVDEARKVIVITGPTATGKSSIALEVCKELGGEIVSCDSVQVYRELSIGCNKPSEQDMQGVRHHLVDIVALSETFTAGEFLHHAQEAIDDILARGKVPVVVGGTMMYVQWLVHGKPDAPKKDRAVAQAVANELLPYHDREDWDGALQILAAESKTRADSLSRNDWYRLSRSLEVLRGANGEDAFTGLRETLDAKYDFRPFFVVGDRERLFRRIDRRCEEMISRGLLSEVAGLLGRGVLDPASPAGRAIGYRQTIEFIQQEEKRSDYGSEGRAPTVTSEDGGNPDARFLQFLMVFAAKTRQYAADQIKWFRSPKGRDFYWQLWDLGGPIKEEARRGTRRNGQGGSSSVQVSRAGDGCSWQEAAKSIAERYRVSREAFEEDLSGEYQEAVRLENQMRAKDMKVYSTKLSLLADGSSTRWRVVEEIRKIAKKSNGVEGGRRGWYAGSR